MKRGRKPKVPINPRDANPQRLMSAITVGTDGTLKTGKDGNSR